jgi:opacity protein-like surface antigen
MKQSSGGADDDIGVSGLASYIVPSDRLPSSPVNGTLTRDGKEFVMQRMCAGALSLCVVLLGVALPAAAQTFPRTEISGGYQFVTFSVPAADGEDDTESIPKGWYFEVAGNLNPMIGLVFQVGGNYKTVEESVTVGGGTLTAEADLDIYQFLGGVRLNARDNPRLVPYGHLLAGAINGSVELTTTSTIPGIPAFSEEDSSTNFGLLFGGGVNFGVTERTGIRFGVDYLRVFADEEEGDGSNVFRFHVGLVIGR